MGSIQEAKSYFVELMQRVEVGEEVIVVKGAKSGEKIVPVSRSGKERRLGGAKGIVKYIADDFDARLQLPSDEPQ